MVNMLEEAGKQIQGIKVISAGTFAMKGQKASENAILVMRERNVDLDHHSATPLTQALIEQADLILTMTRSHKEQVLRMSPEAKGKAYTLKEYVGAFSADKEAMEKIDILDPFGQSEWVYRECANEIEAQLKILLGKLLEAAGE